MVLTHAGKESGVPDVAESESRPKHTSAENKPRLHKSDIKAFPPRALMFSPSRSQ